MTRLEQDHQPHGNSKEQKQHQNRQIQGNAADAQRRQGRLGVRGQQLEFDRHDTPEGDAFAARCETRLTNPSEEPRRSRWRIEVAIKLAEET